MTNRNETILNGLNFSDICEVILNATEIIDNNYSMCCDTRALIEQIEEATQQLYDNTCICEGCGRLLSLEHTHEGYDGLTYCGCCVTGSEESMSPIQDYHAHKGCFAPRDNGESFKVAYRGFELEIESIHDGIDEGFCDILSGYTDSFYFERDGSLTDGVEIITDPMTREYWREVGYKDICNLLTDLRETYRIRSWNGGNCGLHVHFSKDEWSKEAIQFLIKFIIANPTFIKAISGRNGMGYCRIPNIEDYDLDRLISFSRYLAVNFTRETIEFRFFRGSLDLESIYCSVEICDHLLIYAETVIYNEEDLERALTADRFIEFLSETTGHSIQLLQFVARRNKRYYEREARLAEEAENDLE